jgi:hypothetical protein
MSPELQRQFEDAIGRSLERIGRIVNAHDPLKLGTSSRDEYTPLVQTLVFRMTTCHSEGDVLTLLQEEFAAAERDVSETSVRQLAADLWKFWTTGKDPTALPYQD